MPGVVASIILNDSRYPAVGRLLRLIRWGDREPPTTESFEYTGLDGDQPVFDYVASRATDEPTTTPIELADGTYYIDTDNTINGTPADTTFDGDGLVFTPRGA